MISLLLCLSLAVGQDDWRALRVPGAWERRYGGIIDELDGFAWYRCALRVPQEWSGEDLILELGAIDDCDTTFFNGARVGGLGQEAPYRSASAEPRRYPVPHELVRPGEWNAIAVRVFDGGGAGGLVDGRPRLACAKGWLELDGAWDWRPGDDPAWAAPPDADLEALADRVRPRLVRFEDLPSLPGARPLAMDGDPAHEMVGQLVDHLGLHRTPAVVNEREAGWRAALALPGEERAAEWERRRVRLGELLGTKDDARRSGNFERVGEAFTLGAGVTVRAVRWPVFDDVEGEGLLFEPVGPTRASVVVLPDADTSPEAELQAERRSAARLLAAAGCRVLVPRLVDRGTRFAGVAGVGHNELPHREWIYRQAYELGATMIGYEVQSVRSGIDALEAREPGPVGLFGYGEGGSIALYTAALDERVAATVVSGYFEDRSGLAEQPIYRNVWRFLAEYGDAGLARLVASRVLVVEAAEGPTVDAVGSTPGRILPPDIDAVRAEAARAQPAFAELGGTLRVLGDGSTRQALPETMQVLLASLGAEDARSRDDLVRELSPGLGAGEEAQRRLVAGWVGHTQAQFARADAERAASLGGADSTSAETWANTVPALRDRFHAEVLGALPPADRLPNPRARVAYVTDAFVGYEVVLDVWELGFAHGILLVPRDLQPDERRPVVVCQHGLEGRPGDVVNPDVETRYYRSFGARLAERGFVVFAPQNPYLGGDRFRFLQRQANPIGATLFSIIIRQHEVVLDWLGSLPFVDDTRVAFYGLSYGGKTAMRVPAVLDGYCLSICSADFNEWVRKNASVAYPWSYMYNGEYDMAEWRLGRTFGYAEMAALIAPRPFMVERGHHDGVGVDEWVAFEYARVRRFYARLGIPERTEIEFFDGGHVIHGEGTFQFLQRHLGWPE